MNPEARRKPDQEEHRHIQILADEAIALAKELDLDHYPNLHVSRALRGVPEGRERNRLFGLITAELKKRRFKTPQEQRREKLQMLKEAKQQILREDAYKHEAHIDPHEREDEEAA